MLLWLCDVLTCFYWLYLYSVQIWNSVYGSAQDGLGCKCLVLFDLAALSAPEHGAAAIFATRYLLEEFSKFLESIFWGDKGGLFNNEVLGVKSFGLLKFGVSEGREESIDCKEGFSWIVFWFAYSLNYFIRFVENILGISDLLLFCDFFVKFFRLNSSNFNIYTLTYWCWGLNVSLSRESYW